MGQEAFRRATLAAGLVALAGCAGATRGAGGGEGELLRLVPERGEDGQVALRAENVFRRSVMLARAVRIEAVEVFGTDYSARELEGFGVSEGFFLVATCEDRTDGCLQLDPGESIRTVPWSGRYAVPQCDRETASDYPAPPGRYRFVVTACGGGGRFPSEPFLVGSP
jgi:hypothetical protein